MRSSEIRHQVQIILQGKQAHQKTGQENNAHSKGQQHCLTETTETDITDTRHDVISYTETSFIAVKTEPKYEQELHLFLPFLSLLTTCDVQVFFIS